MICETHGIGPGWWFSVLHQQKEMFFWISSFCGEIITGDFFRKIQSVLTFTLLILIPCI